jgi:hypothetical protein
MVETFQIGFQLELEPSSTMTRATLVALVPSRDGEDDGRVRLASDWVLPGTDPDTALSMLIGAR